MGRSGERRKHLRERSDAQPIKDAEVQKPVIGVSGTWRDKAARLERADCFHDERAAKRRRQASTRKADKCERSSLQERRDGFVVEAIRN